MDNTIYEYLQNGVCWSCKKDNQRLNIEYDRGPISDNARVVSVSELSVETIMDKFMIGDMVLSEVVTGLSGRVETFKTSTQNGNILISFTYKGKSYSIQCNTEAASSQIDNNKVITYMEAELKTLYKMTNEDICQYFDAVKTENGIVIEYALKPSTGFKCVGELVNKLNNSYDFDDLLNDLGFPSEYLINKYFELSDDGYKLKSGININNKEIKTIEELRVELNLQTFDEFIESNYSTETGSALELRNSKLEHRFDDYTFSFIAKKFDLPENYFFLTKEALEPSKEQVEKFLSEVAAKLGCSPEDLSAADVIRYMLEVDSDYSQHLHAVYKRYQFRGDSTINKDGILHNVMAGTLVGQIEKLNSGVYEMYKDPIVAMQEVIYNHDSKLMNLPLMQAILSAAGVTGNDSIDSMYTKVSGFLSEISDNMSNPHAPRNSWQSLVIWLFENGYIKETSYSEEEILRVYTPEEKDKFFYPATDANGNIILDENGKQKYYKDNPPCSIICDDLALGLGYTIVHTAEELQKALNNGDSIVLGNDIDMSSIDNWIPVGTEDNPYIGRIEGNGYTIKNLKISGSNQFTGLFGVFGGTVTDLNIENATVVNTNSEFITSTGVFAGKIIPSSSNTYILNVKITNSNVTGSGYVGLLAGRLDKTQINYRFIEVSSCNTNGDVKGNIVGGLIGYCGPDASVNNSTSSANVYGINYAGGIVGVLEHGRGMMVCGHWDFTGNVTGENIVGSPYACILFKSEEEKNYFCLHRRGYEDATLILIGNENFDIDEISNNNEVFVPEHEHTKDETQDLAILKNYISTDNYDGQTSLDYVYNVETGEKIYITDNNWLEIISNPELYGLNEDEKQILIEKTIKKLWEHSEEFVHTEYITWLRAIISAIGGKITKIYTQCYGVRDQKPNFIEFEVNGNKYHLPLSTADLPDSANKNYRPLVVSAADIKILCEKYNINYDDMIKFGGFEIFRSQNDEVSDYWLPQYDLINDYEHYFGDSSNVLDENGYISNLEIIAQILEKAIPRRKAAKEYEQKYGNCIIDKQQLNDLYKKYNINTQHLKIEIANLSDNRVVLNVYNLLVLAYGEEDAINIQKSYNADNIEELFRLIEQNSPIEKAETNISRKMSVSPLLSENIEVTDSEVDDDTENTPSKNGANTVIIKSEDLLEEMEQEAKKLDLHSAKTKGIYYKFTALGFYIYIWDPKENKFNAYAINVRNADGSNSSEFTQTGKVVQRNNYALIYYEALLEAYKLGLNFTVNYPWICEKDGIYYEYDKEKGIFKQQVKN